MRITIYIVGHGKRPDIEYINIISKKSDNLHNNNINNCSISR